MITSFGGAGTRATRGPERHRQPEARNPPRGAPVSGAGSFASPPHDCALLARACTHKLTTHRRTARAARGILWAFLRASWPPRSPGGPASEELPVGFSLLGSHVRGAIAIRLVVTRATRTAYVRGANGTKREGEADREKQDTVIVLDRGKRASAARTEIRTHPDRAVGAGGGAALRPPIERDHGHQ